MNVPMIFLRWKQQWIFSTDTVHTQFSSFQQYLVLMTDYFSNFNGFFAFNILVDIDCQYCSGYCSEVLGFSSGSCNAGGRDCFCNP